MGFGLWYFILIILGIFGCGKMLYYVCIVEIWNRLMMKVVVVDMIVG